MPEKERKDVNGHMNKRYASLFMRQKIFRVTAPF